MPKPKKGGGRGTVVKNLWDLSDLPPTTTHSYVVETSTTHRRPRPVHHVSSTVLKRAFMLQNFQFILRRDLLTITSTQGLPQGQRKLIECLQSSDNLVPWETVHSVVARTTPDEFTCPICMDMPTAPRITECGHVYCLPCVLQYISRQKAVNAPRTCPICHDQLTLYTLRPCVLHPVSPLTAGVVARFDLFRRPRYSCLLRKSDDPCAPSLLTSTSGNGGAAAFVSGQPSIDLPPYMDPAAVQCRYVVTTSTYEETQRYTDGTAISERLRELELEAQTHPLSSSDAEVEDFLMEALNEVTKEPKALAPSLVRSSPPLAPYPPCTTAAAAANGPSDLLELYAEAEGQPFYLHMLTVKMLKHDAALRGQPLPQRVTGVIEEIATMEQTEETRHIYKVFAHVPLHGSIKLCVVNVDHLLLPETRAAFAAAVRRMAQDREQRRLHADRAASEDTSWQQYLNRYNSKPYGSGAVNISGRSPDAAPSDFSLDTGSLPYLQLPSSGSAGSDHGLPPNTLDTRQRATKRQELQPLLMETVSAGSGATTGNIGTSVSTALLSPVTNTSANTGGSGCWGQGSAARLFARHAKAESGGATATWGGHEFRTKS